MKPTPERRSDGICARPGCERLVPTSTAKGRVDVEIALRRESFCSRRCSAIWHGLVVDDLADLIAAYAAGESLGAIAKMFDTDTTSVRIRLEDAGVEVPTYVRKPTRPYRKKAAAA